MIIRYLSASLREKNPEKDQNNFILNTTILLINMQVVIIRKRYLALTILILADIYHYIFVLLYSPLQMKELHV